MTPVREHHPGGKPACVEDSEMDRTNKYRNTNKYSETEKQTHQLSYKMAWAGKPWGDEDVGKGQVSGLALTGPCETL